MTRRARSAPHFGAIGALCIVAACSRAPSPPSAIGAADAGAPCRANDCEASEARRDASVEAAVPSDGGTRDASANASAAVPSAPEPRSDPDGDDDPEDPGTGAAPTSGRFEKVGTPPLALTRICDLTPLAGALYAAHAHQPLGTDGATITKYVPSDAQRPFRVAFDWNRPGEPTKGGGAGQGFVRVHAIGGKLYVPDADPPYGGLGIVDGAEGYVFVSDAEGVFAPSRAPNHRTPATAGIVPRAYHVLDVIRFRGALFTSTGSVPPKFPAWRGPSPGALHRANADASRWIYEVDYPPAPYKDGVWRLTYMVRFRDRLYAGIQDYDGRDPNDFIVFTPPPDRSASSAPLLTQGDVHPTRITRRGGSGTLRWWVDTHAAPHRLYWLGWTRDGIQLRVTIDGDHWFPVELPEDAGRPTDITRFRDAIVVLTETGLYRLHGAPMEGPDPGPDPPSLLSTTTSIALVDLAPDPKTKKKPKSPFEVSDFFCTAPLAVFDNELYAGGQRGGSLYRLVPSTP